MQRQRDWAFAVLSILLFLAHALQAYRLSVRHCRRLIVMGI
jgi:hypothetical protein